MGGVEAFHKSMVVEFCVVLFWFNRKGRVSFVIFDF